jgi:hypothetical protein
LPSKPETKPAKRSKIKVSTKSSKKLLETKDHAQMDGEELASFFFGSGRELPFALIVKNYSHRDEILDDVPAGSTTEDHYGLLVLVLVKYDNNNFN